MREILMTQPKSDKFRKYNKHSLEFKYYSTSKNISILSPQILYEKDTETTN